MPRTVYEWDMLACDQKEYIAGFHLAEDDSPFGIIVKDCGDSADIRIRFKRDDSDCGVLEFRFSATDVGRSVQFARDIVAVFKNQNIAFEYPNARGYINRLRTIAELNRYGQIAAALATEPQISA